MHSGKSPEEIELAGEEGFPSTRRSSFVQGYSISPGLTGVTVRVDMSRQELIGMRNMLMNSFGGGRASALVGALIAGPEGFTVTVRGVKFTGNGDGSATAETTVSFGELRDLKRIMDFANQSDFSPALAPTSQPQSSLFHSPTPPSTTKQASPAPQSSTTKPATSVQPSTSPKPTTYAPPPVSLFDRISNRVKTQASLFSKEAKAMVKP